MRQCQVARQIPVELRFALNCRAVRRATAAGTQWATLRNRSELILPHRAALRLGAGGDRCHQQSRWPGASTQGHCLRSRRGCVLQTHRQSHLARPSMDSPLCRKVRLECLESWAGQAGDWGRPLLCMARRCSRRRRGRGPVFFLSSGYRSRETFKAPTLEYGEERVYFSSGPPGIRRANNRLRIGRT